MKPLTFAVAIYRLLNECTTPVTVPMLAHILNEHGYETSNNRIYIAIQTLQNLDKDLLLVEKHRHPRPSKYLSAKRGFMAEYVVDDVLLATIIGDLASLKEMESRLVLKLDGIEMGDDVMTTFASELEQAGVIEGISAVRRRIRMLMANGYPPIRDYLSTYLNTI